MLGHVPIPIGIKVQESKFDFRLQISSSCHKCCQPRPQHDPHINYNAIQLAACQFLPAQAPFFLYLYSIPPILYWKGFVIINRATMKSAREAPNEKFRRVGQYQLLEILGKGANGIVYKGLNANDGSLVAVKEMLIGKSEMKSIKSELTFLKQLDHQYIVKYLDAVQKENRIYLVLEYVEGGSLAVLAKKSHLSEDIAKLYIKQVLQGLIFLHREGVIHRDIKGANILIDKYGKVKLADFGVAVKLEESQKTISAAGSPYWMAPEIITSQNDPTTKCDIWSLGCTIIELLTGNPPYHELLQFPAIFRIVEDKHPPLPDSSPLCKDFMISCFQKDPLKRASASDLLNHPWLKGSFASLNVLLKTTGSEQFIQQIGQYLTPVPNYPQLESMYKKTQQIKNIILHKDFMNIFEHSENFEGRACFLSKIIKDPDSFIYLSKTGALQKQLQFFNNWVKKKAPSIATQSKSKYLYFIEDILAEIMISKAESCTKEDSIETQHLLMNIIFNHCIKSFCLLLRHYLQNRENLEQVLGILNRFMQMLQLRQQSAEDNHKDSFIVVMKLVEFGGIESLLTHCLGPNQVSCLQLEVIMKIVPSISQVINRKGQYLKFLEQIGEILLQEELEFTKICGEEETTVKFLCLGEVAETEIGKSILQKNGVIMHLSRYFASTVKKSNELNMLHFYEAISIMGKIIKKGKKGNLNRVAQLHRQGTLAHFSFWLEHFERQYKKQGLQNGTKANPQNGSNDLLHKMLQIQEVLQIFRQNE